MTPRAEFVRMARVGLAAKGIVYVTMGALAAAPAFGRRGGPTDPKGALRYVEGHFGTVALAVIALGLVAYAAWRVLSAVRDSESKGSDAKGLAVRAGYLGSGLTHGALALTAAAIALRRPTGDGGSPRSLSARLMSEPGGEWVVGLAGVVLIGTGAYQMYRAWKAPFRRHFASMPGDRQQWAVRLGRYGHVARGVTFALAGVFLIRAALASDAGEARGLRQVLAALAQQDHGVWLLAIVALGLVSYGFYALFLARYRVMRV